MLLGELKQGFLIGLTVSIPVGPIALLIMRRSIQDGRIAGIVSGLGAATVDVICGTVAVVGLKAVTLLIEHHAHFIRLIGALFLLGFGIHTLRTREVREAPRPVHEQNLWRAYLSTAALTIANPLTLVGLVLVSAAAGAGAGGISIVRTSFIVAGIFCGSLSWWTLLSTSAEWLGRKLGPRLLRDINIVAGLLLLAVGIFQIGDLVYQKWA